MKKVISNILFIFTIFYASFASSAKLFFSIYFTNNTPYIIYLSKSNYNLSPLLQLRYKIMPYTQVIKVAATSIKPEFSVSLIAKIGDENNYWNIPLIDISQKPKGFSDQQRFTNYNKRNTNVHLTKQDNIVTETMVTVDPSHYLTLNHSNYFAINTKFSDSSPPDAIFISLDPADPPNDCFPGIDC